MRKVLVAEDEQGLLEDFCDVISSLGHNCLRAADGNEALRLARSERPDLIIADYMLPGRTGIELLRTLRTDPEMSGVPIVLMSAARPRGVEEAWRFLPKPVMLADLERTVEDGLSAAPASAGPRAQPVNVSPIARAREEMLNWVAHEIRSPLSAAGTALQLLDRELGERAPEAKKRIAVISRQMARMNELVTSILDAAQLEDGKLMLRPDVRDAREFVEELVAEWDEAQPDLELVLIGTAVDSPPPLVRIDRARTRQILDNFINNAMKYAGAHKPIEIALEESDSHVRIHVRDRGPGIPSSQLPMLFDRFFRAEGSAGRGHGLGLYIAAALARVQGGSVKATSEEGAGSTFTLELPRVTR